MKKALVKWAIAVIAVPLAAAVIGGIATEVEKKRGADDLVVRGLRGVKNLLRPSASTV